MTKKIPENQSDGDQVESVAKELVAIKNLFVLTLLRQGVSQGEIAAALGISQPTVSRLFSKEIAAVKKSLKNEKR
ncbi:MAG: helix-turn-helix domain-containing protein [Marinicaulis sp.]|nr:helix-turn-helix domain-containing protein [Marinicaulis sp.]